MCLFVLDDYDLESYYLLKYSNLFYFTTNYFKFVFVFVFNSHSMKTVELLSGLIEYFQIIYLALGARSLAPSFNKNKIPRNLIYTNVHMLASLILSGRSIKTLNGQLLNRYLLLSFNNFFCFQMWRTVLLFFLVLLCKYTCKFLSPVV